MNEDIKKLALEALELQKKIKLDQEKLQNIKLKGQSMKLAVH